VNQIKKAVKDACWLTIFLLSITAAFWIENWIHVFLITLGSILLITYLTRNRKQNWPVLLIVVLLISMEVAIGLSITNQIVFCFVLSLIDLFIAFSIVHFHREKLLLKLCGVRQPSPQVPQVFLISFVLALSSLYSFLLGAEMVFLAMDPKLYDGAEPFFVSLYLPVKVTIKLFLDVIIWSLVLETSRWRILRILEKYFNS
jgi:hypothetical protein